MYNLGCAVDGSLNESKFSDPMPWVGVYVVAATIACATAMAADAFHSFRQRKFWFPCKLFSINATTLTLIGVSIKLTVDLNSSMPRRQDQLAKLSSSAFICTIMGNSMPALGTMQNSEIMANVMALIILVITAVANICIELGTGVIYLFWKEHIVLMILMLVLLGIYCSSAITVPATKCYFDLKYRRKHLLAVKECSLITRDVCTTKKLKNDLTKYWVMAHTCSPQFVLGRLATCTAAGAFTLLAALILAEAIFRSYFSPQSFRFCKGNSDYKWSITSILITQTIAVMVGTIAPAFRWFMAINFRCPKKASRACEFKLKVEGYWIQQLNQWKDCPFISRIKSRRLRKLAHALKNVVFDVCISTQKGIVLMSKIVRLISIFSAGKLLACHRFFKKLISFFKCHNNVWNDEETESNQNIELGRFVLHLEGEEVLVDLILENDMEVNEKWIESGKTDEPKHLLKLLEKSRASEKFIGVNELDNHIIPPLELEEPKNSWALTVVTLTTIAVTIPNIDQDLTKQLTRSVHEGLIYVRLVEENLKTNDDLLKVRRAAEITWIGVDLHRKWLDVDIKQISEESKTPEGILNKLAETGKKMFFDVMEKDKLRCLKEGPSEWDVRALAANSMYKIASAVNLDYETKDYDGGERLFERLTVMISDILAACLTNLPKVIPMECNRSSIEEREGSVHRSFLLLGKLHKIIESLDGVSLPSLEPEELACIDGWRKLSNIKKEQVISSDHVYLCIE
ncbi:uncharacterized protein LOC124941454 [Impatiens glandulifera]|uniref:uncharacterized protein LOC124941454 n=1 Tax=Impatiens glandulifera TaxID=253017 RepID=UPI001FB16EAB|nr:uncharacterized protein LOC124941454 [Impatiens glandulifera]